MSIGGIALNLPMMPDATAVAEAEAAAPAPLPDPAAQLPAPLAPPPVPDLFAPPPAPEIALPDLGAGAAPTTAAYHDFVSAKQDLRQAKAETPGNGHRRADIRQARHEVRQARAELNAQTSGAGAQTADAFVGKNAVDTAALGHLGDAQAPVALQKTGGNGQVLGQDLPVISQLHPKGNDGTYANGDMNCAPTALAMIARGHPDAMLDGKPVSQMPDAALINRIGKHADTNNQGTSPNGFIAAAEDMGFKTTSHMGGFNQSFFDTTLAQGGSVAVNGAYFIGDQLAGHFVTVAAKTQDGNYVVNDPLQGRVVWTADDLNRFLLSNPVNGGVSIGVY